MFQIVPILEAGVDTETIGGLLTFSSWFATHGLLSLFFYRTENRQSRDGITQWAGPSPLNH